MTRSGSPADRAGRLGEFERIARWLAPLTAHCPGAFGLTDDAAVLAVPAGRELVVTNDGMVAGIHFLPGDPPADVAAKLLRVNLSDLAAMAAEPYVYTLTTALPPDLPDRWLAGFAAGLGEDQAQFGVALAGGDSVSTPGPISVTATLLGLVPAGGALRRATAAVGDDVYVSGTIGDAALGLLVALADRVPPGDPADPEDAAAHRACLARLRRPIPRLALGRGLRGVASAAIDVSDGLVADLGHLCRASGVAARIAAPAVPVSDAARRLLAAAARGGGTGGAAPPPDLGTLLTGGDDYELVFTAPLAAADRVAAAAAAAATPVARIGSLVAGPVGAVEVLDTAGRPLGLGPGGFRHF